MTGVPERRSTGATEHRSDQVLGRLSGMGHPKCAGETEQPSTEGLLYLWVITEPTHIQASKVQESHLWGKVECRKTKKMD